MAWFRVDDRLHDHRKVRKLRRSHPEKSRDVTPFGIWAMAGSWCGSNPTGGFIPTEVLLEYDDDAEEMAERLVDAKLWWHDEVDGEPGYRFHDWADQNPHDGTDPGDYGRRGNHIRWHVKRGEMDPECPLCVAPTIAPSRPESGTESSRPVPSRPVPTNTGDENAFDTFWSTYPRKIAKGQARKAWKAALKKVDSPLLLDACDKFAQRSSNSDAKFIPYPATWLNGERWADETTTGPQTTADGRLVLPPLPKPFFEQ